MNKAGVAAALCVAAVMLASLAAKGQLLQKVPRLGRAIERQVIHVTFERVTVD
jgi:hypothetical protein